MCKVTFFLLSTTVIFSMGPQNKQVRTPIPDLTPTKEIKLSTTRLQEGHGKCAALQMNLHIVAQRMCANRAAKNASMLTPCEDKAQRNEKASKIAHDVHAACTACSNLSM